MSPFFILCAILSPMLSRFRQANVSNERTLHPIHLKLLLTAFLIKGFVTPNGGLKIIGRRPIILNMTSLVFCTSSYILLLVQKG